MDPLTPRGARTRRRSDEGRSAGGVARGWCAGTELGDGRDNYGELRLHERRDAQQWRNRQGERGRQTIQVQALVMERGGMFRLVIYSYMLNEVCLMVRPGSPLMREVLRMGRVGRGMQNRHAGTEEVQRERNTRDQRAPGTSG